MSIRLQYLREAWSFLSSFVGRAGEVVVDTTNNRLVVHDGVTAGGFPSLTGKDLQTLQKVTMLGVQTTADATNRLAVKADGVLFSWDDVTPGAGNMRLTLNKKLAANDAELLLQTGASTRGAVGLLGDDKLSFKVSADGSAFVTPLIVDPNGSVRLNPIASDPSGGALGQIYANSTATALKWFNGSAWARINNFAKFAAYTSFDNYIGSGSWTKVQFNNADSNDQGAFSAGSNRLVAPEAGLYSLATSLVFKKNGSNNPTAFEVQFYKNGAAAGRGRAAATGALVDSVTTLGLTTILKLAASDYVEVFVRFTATDGYVASTDSFFGGMQLA